MSDETLQRPTFDTDFPLLHAVGYHRPRETFGNESYFRVGDTAFEIAPGNITVHEKTDNHVEDVLRTPGGIVMANGFAEKEILASFCVIGADRIFGLGPNACPLVRGDREITTTLDGNPQPVSTGFLKSPPIDNNSLAALIAQFKRMPILPVINSFLNYSHDIAAVALQAMQVETALDGNGRPIPNMVNVTLVMTGCAIEALCPSLIHFDAAIIWPLARWNYRQAYAAYLPGQYRIICKGSEHGEFPKLTPAERSALGNVNQASDVTIIDRFAHDRNQQSLPAGMNADFQFLKINGSYLKELASLRDAFNKLQALILSDQFRTHSTRDEIVAATGSLEDLNNTIQAKTREDSLRMDPVALGGPGEMVLTHMAATITNGFAIQRPPSSELPIYQHMTQGDVKLTATFWAYNDAVLAKLRNLVKESRELARTVRFEMVAGFVGFENELASLFGVQAVVFTDIQARPMEQLPGNYLVTIEMIGFNRFQRRIEELQKANGNSDEVVPQWVGEGKFVAIDESDPRTAFWARYYDAKNYNDAHDPSVPSGLPEKTQADSKGLGPGYDEIGRPTNAWFNMAYIQEAKEQMAHLELYPDLALPTYQRLAYAINTGEIFSDAQEIIAQGTLQKMRWEHWTEQGRYVDPDFYMDYPNSQYAKAIVTGPTPGTGMLSIAAQLIATTVTNPVVATNIDGTYRSAITSALFDSYPDGVLLGSRQAEALDADSPEARRTSRGHNTAVGTISFPSPLSTGSNLLLPTARHPEFTEDALDIDGVRCTNVIHPNFDDFLHHPGKAPGKYADQKTSLKLPGLPEAAKAGQDQVLGENTPAGKDPTPLLAQALMAHHPVDVGYTVADEHGRMIGMLYDTLQYDRSGRLVMAYPAYCLQLIDEGPDLGWAKLFPNFFALQSIQSIDVIQDRRDPIHTCMLEIMNTYQNLSNYTALQVNLNAAILMTQKSDTQMAIRAIAKGIGTSLGSATLSQDLITSVESGFDDLLQHFRNLFPSPSVARSAAALRRKQNSVVMLQAGVRIHVRLGYGSNAASMPIAFNGRVVDIGHGERIQVVAQGDGLELAKLVPGAESETTSINKPDTGYLAGIAKYGLHFNTIAAIISQSFDPRELICQMLGSHGVDLFDYSLLGEAWNNIKKDLFTSSNGAFFNQNPIGIAHFGNPYLFNIWDYISGKGLEGPPQDSDIGLTQLRSYQEAMNIGHASTSSLPGELLKIGQGVVNQASNSLSSLSQFSGPAASGTSVGFDPFAFLVGTGDVFQQGGQAAGAKGNVVASGVGNVLGFLFKTVGEAGMLTHHIPSGYGEVGENVYGIYTPFTEINQNAGSLFTKAGQAFFLAAGRNVTGATAIISDATSKISQDINSPALPSTSNTPNMGPSIPGVGFNMFLHNKTAWDVISTMAQYFPPYIAAVRPFEYRSTLFFGAPYWQYRYDYERMTALDLGQAKNTTADKYFGYPVAYRVKPFCQFHIYDSKSTLLHNTVRASDEDTYTNVIAMWYSGKGFTGGKPSPIPVKQTVDRAIGAAFKKTSIVNTDVLGVDVAPSAGAIIGSLGVNLIPYFATHAVNLIGKLIGKPGIADTFFTEENMRQMARAILRDYQKLMYQGQILVLGDPTAKPFDWMYIKDDYTDVSGPAQVRRVIHHLGMDTGFVTSIEPDLMCEVKGESYMASAMLWLTGYLTTNTLVRYGSAWALASGRRRVLNNIAKFGLNLKKKSLFSKLKSRIGLKIAGAEIDEYEPRFLLYTLRNLFLDGFYHLLDASGTGKILKTQDFGEVQKLIVDAMTDARALHGKGMLDEAGKRAVIKGIDKLIADTAENDGAKIIDKTILQAVKRNLLHGVGVTLDTVVERSTADYFARRALARVILQSAESKKALLLSPLKSLRLFGQTLKLSGSIVKAVLRSGSLRALNQFGVRAAVATIGKASLTAVIGESELAFGVGTGGVGFLIDAGIDIVIGLLWTAASRWWDDETSLQMMFLKFRGAELQAGLNGHQDAIVMRAPGDEADDSLTPDEMKALRDAGYIKMSTLAQRFVQANSGTSDSSISPEPVLLAQGDALFGTAVNTVRGYLGIARDPLSPLGSKYSTAQREAIIAHHSWLSDQVRLELINDVHDDVIGLLQYFTTHNYSVEISAAKGGPGTSHPTPSSGPFGGHAAGDAIDVTGISYQKGPLADIKQVPSTGYNLIKTGMAYGCPAIGVWEYDSYFKLDRNIAQEQVKVGSCWVFIDSPAHIHFRSGG